MPLAVRADSLKAFGFEAPARIVHRWSTRRTQIERRWTLASVNPLFSPLSPIFREQADRQEDRLGERPGEALGGGISDEVFEGGLMIEEECGWEMVTVKTPNSSGSKGRGRKGLGVLRNQGHSRFTGFSRSPARSRRDCCAPSCRGDRRAVIYAFPPIVYSSKKVEFGKNSDSQRRSKRDLPWWPEGPVLRFPSWHLSQAYVAPSVQRDKSGQM